MYSDLMPRSFESLAQSLSVAALKDESSTTFPFLLLPRGIIIPEDSYFIS
jgi:hypothetical protein